MVWVTLAAMLWDSKGLEPIRIALAESVGECHSPLPWSAVVVLLNANSQSSRLCRDYKQGKHALQSKPVQNRLSGALYSQPHLTDKHF